MLLQAESLQPEQRDAFYQLLSARLKEDKKRVHADAPRSALIVRTVFPTLDASRVSKYARTLDAVRSHAIEAAKFAEFVQAAGGIERVQHAPVNVLVPAKPAQAAVPETFKAIIPAHVDEAEDDLTEDETVDAEYALELSELLEQRRATPFLTVSSLTTEQVSHIDQHNPARVLLVAELVDGELRVFEQVPFDEDAIARAYRVRYPSCDLLRQAIKAVD